MYPEALKPEACPHLEFYFPPCKVPLATGAVNAGPSTPLLRKSLFFLEDSCTAVTNLE